MKQRKTPMSAGFCLTLAALLTASCGKKSSGSNDDKSSTGSSTTTTGGGPGVTTNSGNDLVVTGQLAISTLALADAPKGVLAFISRNGDMRGEPQVIDVDGEGKFRVPIKRSEDGIKVLVEEAAKARDQRDWDRMYQALRDAFPEQASKMSLDQIKSMSEDEVQDGIGSIADSAKKAGPVTLLVAYDKTGDKVSEAASFRFISMPTPEGKPLSAIPNERLKGDIGLGKVTGSGRDVTSETKSKDAVELSDNAMESLADAGRALKNVINSYMNQDWKAQPFYFWKSSQGKSSAVDAFSDVGATSYQGYGFYIGSNGDQGLTYSAVCGAKSVTFTPPEPVTVAVNQGQSTATVTSYDNSSSSQSTQGSNRICSNNSGYYVREDVDSGRTSFMMNFGTGGSITTSPKGLWRLKVDGAEVARFDFDAASPVVDSKPVVPIPSVKYITSGGQITGVEVELYRWNGSGFAKIDDLSGFKRLVSDFHAGYTSSSGNGDYETKLTIGDDNKITGVFDSSETQYGGGGARNPPVAIANVTAFAVYYVIGNASYRLELR